MRCLAFVFLLIATACGQNSSPEGRLTGRLDKMQREMDSIKQQNQMIRDSLDKINENLKKMRKSETAL